MPSARWRPCRASCPADRWLLPATCCALSWPPLLLPAFTCANGSRPKRLSSSRTQVGCSGAQCLRSGSHTFYMLLTLSYMDNPLGDFSQLPNSGSSARARPPSLARRPTLAGLSIGPTVQAGLGLYLQACRRPCRHGYHEPEASGFNAFVSCHSLSVTLRLLRDGMHTRPSSLLRGLHFARA